MPNMEDHPILSQLNERERQLKNVDEIQAALKERRRILERDGKLTTVASAFFGITGLFFMQKLPFFLILGLLVIGVPLVWRHLVREAREFAMSNEEIETVLKKTYQSE